MAKTNNKVTIDFDVWQTQAQYAAEKKIRLGTVSQWVVREKGGIKDPKVETFTIDQLGITLVKK